MANSDNEAIPAAIKTKTTRAKLRCTDLSGQTVNTRWGDVTFDEHGRSELEVPEDEVQMLRDIKPFSWLLEDHVSFNRSEEARKAAEDGKGKKAAAADRDKK